MSSDAQIVQALYSFKGTNNDELCFQKGDFITITQCPDGGWWEGTLGEITGWFPSNYVREVKDPAIVLHNSHDAANISIVYKDLLDSEKAHVDELQGLFTNFLMPLERSTILTTDEYKQLIGNFTEVLETHQVLLQFIGDENQKPHKEQKIGRHFLQHAPRMKAIHQAYCSLHPKAVCILDKYKEELTKYMESCGANSPGVLVLTTGLSKPFRRLAKYSGMLLEVERHVEDSHPDRGDIQRSVAVYKEIDTSCAATRRQKELELQVLTGPVRGWEGQSLSSLGDIIYMGSVAVGPQHLDRYLVLFPTTLLILSVSHRLSAFIYEGKLPVTGINVSRLEDSDQYKNAFEISGPLIDKVTAVCQSKDEANHWVDILRKYNPNRITISNKSPPSQAEMVPQPPPHLNSRGYCTRTSILKYTPTYDYIPTYPCQYYPPTAPYAALSKLYHQLFKQKVITRKLLKILLYPEYSRPNNFANVQRRLHRSECFIFKNDSNCDTDSSSDCSSDDSKRMCRQNAFDGFSSNDDDDNDTSSSSSNPFGYIRYYNPQTGSKTETDNESFIDHFKSRVKAAQPRESKKPSIVLTSSAKLELVTPRDFNKCLKVQLSQESEASSCVTPNNALENLTKLNGSFEIGPGFGDYRPIERQSCPNKLVADKFNECSLTTLYIPPCQSDNNLALKWDVTSSHSSSIDLAVNTLPIPDGMLADILYNCDDEETVFKPPSMFDESNGAKKKSLTLSNVGFKKHSLNSDKHFKRRSSIQMSSDLLEDNYTLLNNYYSPDQHSPRSSDSGMAGSCTLNSEFPARCSTEMANRNIISLMETYEAQCRCTSPFGSTPRTSADVPVIHSTHTSVTSAEIPTKLPTPWESENQIHSKFSELQHSKSMGAIVTAPEEKPERGEVYKSGLYAHWWLKAKIPAEVVKGIYEETREKKTDVRVGRNAKQ
ncbi:PREDICTED: uncharacterized protein LOC108565852 [Nicrophorus vespilloides]|uniref:Uncharacterized protein LOC108565852 n=1 Tax=Nicrophorus vespilloides TaxID=110193 RepID=A0ABM1N2E2_NICVS|nr:PREDICTED: uncharacterized protein LOC108565852 [Nicrophorus vespilloides]